MSCYISSGISLGINTANKLFLENNSSIYTINKELKDKNLISLSASSGNSLNFGFFDFESNSYHGKIAQDSTYTGFNNFYLINFLFMFFYLHCYY